MDFTKVLDVSLADSEGAGSDSAGQKNQAAPTITTPTKPTAIWVRLICICNLFHEQQKKKRRTDTNLSGVCFPSVIKAKQLLVA
jgi:hypothetical protein